MIQAMVFNKDGSFRRDLAVEEITTVLQETGGYIWINLEEPTETELFSILRDTFRFHPLTIEDCQSVGYQTPKVDDFNRYIFIVVNAVRFNHDLSQLETRINLFLGHNYLVTVFMEGVMPPIAEIRKRIEIDERLRIHGSDFLCHAILDKLVDDFMPLLEQMDDEIEELGDQVIEKPSPMILEKVLSLKHQTMTLRRVIGPQREVINRFCRDEFTQIDPQSKVYFRDIYDHLVRIQDLIESIRDIISSVLDIYLSSTSLRLNEIMKALTIVSTIFLPLSFIAGIYGMNFQFMPELGWDFGYPMVWFICIIVATTMLLFIKRRGWF